MTNEKIIWEFLIGKGLTEAGVAGLMGNLYAESGLSPQNLQNSYEKKLGYTDMTYTAAVDSGKYTDFVHDSAGYGLAQWTYWSRKEGLLKLTQKKGVSIGNLQMQLEYLIWELETSYKAVLSTLKSTDSVKEASDAVLLQFEKPADQSAAVQKKRTEYSQKYYDTFAGGGNNMAYSNSPLVDYTKISPNRNSPRNNKIKKITIHHMAGNMSVESCGASFARSSRQAQSNYGIDSDGRVGMYVEEKDRSWCSSSPENDHQAVTIEVANDGGAPNWHVSDKALAKLIDLCVDICKRNGIQKLNYTGDKSGNLTMHKWFAATACVPTYTEVLTRDGWKRIDEVRVGEEIACADLDNLRITFEAVYDKVPVKEAVTYTNCGVTVTADHRLVYKLDGDTEWKIEEYGKIRKNKPIIPFVKYDELLKLVTLSAEEIYNFEHLSNEDFENKPELVTCVSVPTGIILIRQHGKTFVVGNCPGPYLESKFPYIAEEVNKRLGVAETKKGWVKSGASWMWYENGKPVTNCWRKITGDSGVPYWYYLGPGGKMLTGMQKIQGKVYYLNPVAALGVPEGACIMTDENGVVNRG